MVAIASDSQSAPDERVVVDSSNAGSENITLATIAPTHPPIVWATMYRPVSRVLIDPNPRATNVTAGLKCAPDTAPNMRISPMSAPAVAAAFSSNCRPTSVGDRLAGHDARADHGHRPGSPVPIASATRRLVRSRRSCPVPVSTATPSSLSSGRSESLIGFRAVDGGGSGLMRRSAIECASAAPRRCGRTPSVSPRRPGRGSTSAASRPQRRVPRGHGHTPSP